ncbi:hypothetical protein JOC54_002720 [Alkalihalobacillus xiaoxiensis]|uniref:DoxX-like family protein n=1 Tax=Shouchella xiaoxiensis TaxID=766895 RepID=A0ABS2SV84_9BACI|nr:DoxX-like family protein [Shouchella xiaoxiensis]MBM7839440.1 hypothetical protein [Shouchella xiaoxiensis]
MSKSKPIYVETFIKSELDTVWMYTQEPDLHQQWDLRFSDITYIPKEEPDAPQQFTYQTNIGFGLKIKGAGESVGEHVKKNEKLSSLKFWADHPLSLIDNGGGYWKYIEHDGGVQFMTQYNYQTKWGPVGRIIDLIFKPLMGWATAWSFDALRLWLEKGIPPALSVSRSLIFLLCSFVLAFTWVYQGLVPKLLFQDSGELALFMATGWFQGNESLILYILGSAQVLVGIGFLFWSDRRWLHYLSIVALLGLGIGSLIQTTSIYAAPFNPATLTIAMVALSLIILLNRKDLPFASNCKRTKDGRGRG